MSSGNTTGLSGVTSGRGLDTADLVVIVVYLVLCLVVGLVAAWRTQRGSISGYFLAGRDMQWFAVGASIFSSDFGTGAVLGMAGTGAASGIAVACFELNAIFTVLLLGWFFVPVYVSAGVYTLPEYLKKRFGGRRLQMYMAVLSLILCIFTKLAPDMYAGAVFIQQVLGWNMYLGVAVLLAITAVYTVTGGLKAVIYTDTLQTGILLIGCVILSVISYDKVGGLPGIYEKYLLAVPSSSLNSSCGWPSPESLHLVNHPVTGAIPWPANLLGVTVLSAWYFCTDQVMVQRSLAAKNMHHVKGGSILASYFKMLPLFLIIFPGMISRILFTDEVACMDPDVCRKVCGNPAGCTNIAYPKLIMEVMPRGVKGVMLAGMLAFLMSTLTSVFNSASTIFTIDIWQRVRPRAADGELLIVGRLFVLVMVAIAVLWLPIVQSAQQGQMFNYIQSMTSVIAPPVLAVFLMALIWERTTEPGAFWGLMVGLVAGVARAALQFSYDEPGCGEPDTRPEVLSRVHFLYFAVILFLLTGCVTGGVSLVTSRIPSKHLVRLTWRTRHSDERRVSLDEVSAHSPAEYVVSVAEDQDVTHESSSCWSKLLYLACGYEKTPRKAVPEAELEEQLRKFTSIREDPKWARFVNVNGVVVMVITAFLWGYFA